MPKKIILTIDYELFFGEKEGTIDSCMVNPTKYLADIISRYDSKMTIFWDILHYWKLTTLSVNNCELLVDKIKIEEQIIQLSKDLHDVQLHIHPHWLDTSYENGKWHFDLTGYRLHSLSQIDDPENIRSISGCINLAKLLIEKVCQQGNAKHTINSFRAGGYCIQPFAPLQNIFLQQGILIDSSVCHGFVFDKPPHSYNFANIPKKLWYRFNNEVEVEFPLGDFLEFPIGSIEVTPLKVLYWAFLLRTKYRKLGDFKENSKIIKEKKTDALNSKILTKLIKTFKEPRFIMLSSDGFFKEKINFLLDKAEEYSVMIIHPKYLNNHVLSVLENQLKKGKIQFCSINEIYNNNVKKSFSINRCYK